MTDVSSLQRKAVRALPRGHGGGGGVIPAKTRSTSRFYEQRPHERKRRPYRKVYMAAASRLWALCVKHSGKQANNKKQAKRTERTERGWIYAILPARLAMMVDFEGVYESGLRLSILMAS